MSSRLQGVLSLRDIYRAKLKWIPVVGFKKQFQNNELQILAPKLHFIKQL